jgi:hypothetical protein
MRWEVAMRRTPTTLVAALLLASCGGGSTTDFPTGTFVHEVNRGNVFEFTDDGKWRYYMGGRTIIAESGTYRVEGNLYIEETVSDPECNTPGTYEWTYQDGELTFTLHGEDPCFDRVATLNRETYHKSDDVDLRRPWQK